MSDFRFKDSRLIPFLLFFCFFYFSFDFSLFLLFLFVSDLVKRNNIMSQSQLQCHVTQEKVMSYIIR